jgi:hypothetical protein
MGRAREESFWRVSPSRHYHWRQGMNRLVMNKAVYKYPLGTTDQEKIAALEERLIDAACELIDLGVSLRAVEVALDDAFGSAEDQLAWKKDRGDI